MTLEFQQMLRGAALRVTKPRVAVLGAVHDRPHADTDSIIEAVRRGAPGVSHQAVYDVLRALTAAGLVRRIQPSGSVARYESRVSDNHHHVVCRSCGLIADVDCAVGEAPCLTASDGYTAGRAREEVTRTGKPTTVPGGDRGETPAAMGHGFTIDEAEVTYWGLCQNCSTAGNPGSH